jgi:hypothetical protein
MKVLSISQIVQGVKESKLQNRDLVYVKHLDLVQNTKYDEYYEKYHIDNIYFNHFSSKTFYFHKETNEQVTDKFMLQRIEYIEDMWNICTNALEFKMQLKQFYNEYNIYPESCLLMELEIKDPENEEE